MSNSLPTRPDRNRFRPALEGLEDRAVPAGNVAAAVTGGTLRVVGDNQANAIHITSAGRYGVVITPTDGTTTVNGQAGPVLFGGVKYGIDIRLGEGDDSLSVAGLTAREYLFIDTGGGSDTVILSGVVSKRATSIVTGPGDDSVGIVNSDFRKIFALNTGDGNDRVSIGASRFGPTILAIGGPGFDTLGGDTVHLRGTPVVLEFETIVPTTIPLGGAAPSPPVVSPPIVDATPPDTPPPGGDTTRPTVTVGSPAPDPTRTSPIPFTVTFSEDVSGFSAAGVRVTNGTVASVTPSGVRTFTVTVVPTADGPVSVSVPAGAARDAAGNLSLASNTLTRTFDTTAPTVTASPQTTNDTTPTLTGTVSEPQATVSVTVGGQTFTADVASNGTWSGTVPNPLPSGTYAIDVTATDPAGNSTSITVPGGLIIDSTAPTVSVTTTSNSPTDADAISFLITFSEPVLGFTAGDVLVTNGTVGPINQLDPQTFDVTINPIADGPVAVTVPAGAVTDAAGNPNTAGNVASVVSERFPPTVVVTANAPDPTRFSPIPFRVTFNEDVTGFEQADVQVTNGTVTSFTRVDARTYDLTVTPGADGVVTVTVPAGVATDIGGRTNEAATPVSRTFDSTPPDPPVVTGLDPASDTGPSDTDGVTSDTTPTVIGTAEAGSTVQAFVDRGFGPVFIGEAAATGGAWSITPTLPLDPGTYAVTARATDAAGNVSLASAPFTLVVDTTGPTLTVTSPGSPTNASPIPFTVTFSEAAAGFTAADVQIANGTLASFTQPTPETFIVSVTPNADGPVTVTVPGGVATDLAGNANVSAASFSVISDRTAPTGTVAATAPAGAMTGTATDGSGSGVAAVAVSLQDIGTGRYWNGTAFLGTTEQFFPAVDTSGNGTWSSWSFAFTGPPGQYAVRARMTDTATNQGFVATTVTVTP